mgnify:CR=1 FL=1
MSTFEGKVIVFTAPSGAGKTTIVRHLLKVNADLGFSVSATTRSRRAQEVDGKDYYFLTEQEFLTRKQAGEFLEWEEVYDGLFYGTLKSEVDRLWSEQKHIVFDVDVKGALRIKSHFSDRCMAVFVQPPSLKTLIDRLKARGSEDTRSLQKRISRIKHELTFGGNFDAMIINDVLEVTLKEAELMVEDFLVS